MSDEGRRPLDHVDETSGADRAARFAGIERRDGAGPGAKEMALTRKAREEDQSLAARRLLEVERRGAG